MPIKRVNDFFVKYLLGNEKNKDISLSFINSVFAPEGMHFSDIEFKNKDMEPEKDGGKLVKLDIRGQMNSGEQLDIEVQVFPFQNMEERTLYYWSRMYSEQLHESEDYENLKPCLSVVMLNFELLKNRKVWYNSFSVRENTDSWLLTDHLKIIFLELPKLASLLIGKELEELPPVEQWGAYFLGTVDDKKLEGIPMLKEALKEEQKFSQDEKLRYEYEMREKAIRDYRAGLAYAKKQGLEQGIQQGVEETQKKTIIAMIKKGFGNDMIKELVEGISDEFIDAIRKEVEA